MKLANALMLTSILLSNITGVAQAGAQNKTVSGANGAANVFTTTNSYNPPSFAHPEPRIAAGSNQRYSGQSNLASTLSVVYLSDLHPSFSIEG